MVAYSNFIKRLYLSLQLMELDFINNVNEFDESVVRLYNFNREEAILFRDLIQNTGNNVTVDWVVNGEKVLEKVASNHYDIILMDIEMPLKNGYETSSEIRKSENTKINNRSKRNFQNCRGYATLPRL